MNIYVYISFFLLIFLGCQSPKDIAVEESECEEYHAFLEENIIKHEGGWYRFKSAEAIFKKYDEGKYGYPLLGKCIKGKDKAYFIEHFGALHRELVVPHKNYNVFIYCFDEVCMNESCFSKLSSGLIYYFDENDQLIDLFTTIGYHEAYRMSNRKFNFD